MSISDLDYVRHILDEIRFVDQVGRDISLERFLDDEILKRAVVRSLEVIGEASKKISNEFKARHPDVEWRKMAGMRDRLIHNYFGVDYPIVYDVVVNKIPTLQKQCIKLLESDK